MEERPRRDTLGCIVSAAKKVTTRRARVDQPGEFENLRKTLNGVSEETKTRAVFRVMTEVIEEKAPLQGLYALCWLCQLIPVAHGASAIMKLLQEGALQEDLEGAGLAELKGGKYPHWVYRVGHAALMEAAGHFRNEGQVAFAQTLEEHLREGERRQREKQARRKARKQEATA